jgi:hypothetical protein
LPDQFGGKLRKTLETSGLMTVLDNNSLSLDIAEITQTLPKCLQSGRVSGSGNRRKISHSRDFLQLLSLDRNAKDD